MAVNYLVHMQGSETLWMVVNTDSHECEPDQIYVVRPGRNQSNENAWRKRLPQLINRDHPSLVEAGTLVYFRCKINRTERLTTASG